MVPPIAAPETAPKEGEAQRCTDGGGAQGAVVRLIGQAGNLAVGISAALILILLEHFERLVGRRKDADCGTDGLHGAAGKQTQSSNSEDHPCGLAHKRLLQFVGADRSRYFPARPFFKAPA